MARRRYQTGTLILRGKTWLGRWREDVIGSDGHTRRVRRAQALGTLAELPTKKLARRRLELLLAKVNAPGYRPGRVATLREFTDRWEKEVLSQRKPSTAKAARAHLTHILPALGDLRLDQLTVENQQAFVTRLSKSLKRKTVLNVIGTLSAILNIAKSWGYGTETVTLGRLVLPPKGIRSTARFFTAEEARQIIGAAREPFTTLYALAAMTGMRAGELLGLCVKDLDFERRLIVVQRSLWGGKLQAPKSESSVRVLPMPEPLAARLKRFLQTWRPNPESLVFATRRCTPMNAQKVVQRNLQPLLVKLGIPRAGLHAFRHTHSSLLIEQGAPPTIAQAQLGHSDPRITLAVYAHIVGDSHRQAVEKLAGVLDSNGPQPGGMSTVIQ